MSYEIRELPVQHLGTLHFVCNTISANPGVINNAGSAGFKSDRVVRWGRHPIVVIV